jgi:hypothetical protein
MKPKTTKLTDLRKQMRNPAMYINKVYSINKKFSKTVKKHIIIHNPVK